MEQKGELKILSPGPKDVGVPLNVTTPDRVRPSLPEPRCSPVAQQSPFSEGIGMGGTPLSHPSPSPGSRKFVGVSSNARNDIYMKTLMNSPYHKFTPLSATPNGQSPNYHTPIRAKPVGIGSPIKGLVGTPAGTVPPWSQKKFVTPKNLVFNPFDCGVDDLHLPAYMSPGFFTEVSTPASEEKLQTFGWAIEHIAELNPADIEEMPAQQTHMMVDKETEERAQKAIDQFFSNNLIVPSPWSDPKQKKTNILPVTPASQGGKATEEMITELQGSIQKSLPKQGMEDVACQTVLSLPTNIDLQKVLGEYMTQDSSDEGNQQEMLSTSSLRRKLFFHGDTSSLAPSPVKGAGVDEMMDPGSPVFVKRTSPHLEHITPLKNTPAFSSSPIKSAGTPNYRRCSSDPEFLVSPELSPIVHGNIHNPVRMSRSSGLFEVDRASFNISPENDEGNKPKHCPVSPIPFHGISPEDNDRDDYHLKLVDSPGFSPICPPKTQIRKILRRSQEESYLKDDGCSSSEEDVESITPVSSNPRHHSTYLTPVQSLMPKHRTTLQKTVTCVSKSHSCTDLTETAMDYESETCTGKDNILTSSLCETRDFSMSNIDSQDDTNTRIRSCSQDTGYQTASLQSTNPESVLHTNLTNQFGSLPFNLTSQEQSIQLGSSQDNPPICNLLSCFSEDLADTKKSGLSISKQLFPTDPLYPSSPVYLGEEEENEHTANNQGVLSNQSNDSAQQDDSAIVTDLGAKSMAVDFRKGDIGTVISEGEEILSRAREALAMANSLYPQKVTSQLPKSVSVKSETHDIQSRGDQLNKEPSASDIAYSIIQRAGEDLAKYGNILTYQKTSENVVDTDLSCRKK